MLIYMYLIFKQCIYWISMTLPEIMLCYWIKKMRKKDYKLFPCLLVGECLGWCVREWVSELVSGQTDGRLSSLFSVIPISMDPLHYIYSLRKCRQGNKWNKVQCNTERKLCLFSGLYYNTLIDNHIYSVKHLTL